MTPISQESAPGSTPSRSDLSPLRPVAWPPLACAALAVVGGVVIAWTHQATSGAGFAAGVGLATASFLFSALVIAWADLVDRRLILPIGLLTYVLKIVLIGMVVFAVARQDWPGFTAMLWGIAAGTATWVTAQAVWAYRQARRADPDISSDTVAADVPVETESPATAHDNAS